MTASRALPLVQLPVLLVLGALLGWGTAGWAAALVTTALLDVAVHRLLRRTGTSTFGPADPITLGRATLTCGVLALAVEHLLGAPARPLVLAGVAAVSLVLDLVDGWVARRSGTQSPFGGRFDGEADAYLMLVLSAWVAPDVGWWVLAIGLARYAFWLAGRVLPWMRRRLPFRAWRKVVTAVAGIALVAAAARVLPSLLVVTGLLIALALLAESFGRDVLWLWRQRRVPATDPVRSPTEERGPPAR